LRGYVGRFIAVWVERKSGIAILPPRAQVDTLPEPVEELADTNASLHIQWNVDALTAGCCSDAIDIEVYTR
jgi:hypothetical protein